VPSGFVSGDGATPIESPRIGKIQVFCEEVFVTEEL
jgi:hypothetical protein